MNTLVLHTPSHRGSTARSFEDVLKVGIGDRYAIYSKLVCIINPGYKVVVLRKDKNKRRAEGTLVKLVEKNKADNGIQRYDVHIKGLEEVPYKPERLNRCGIAVIRDN